MKNWSNICDPTLCTGCLLCYNVCNHGAIRVVENEKGFYTPAIAESKCVDCKKCIRSCLVNCPLPNQASRVKKVYAAWSVDEHIRSNSTSGGFFYYLASCVINAGGWVWGASIDEYGRVRHIKIADAKDLQQLQGSKYVQSYIGDSYQDVKQALQAARAPVLFSGTPCQCAALKAYLGKDYDQLITMDFVCHGVPSYGLFKSYLDSYIKPQFQSSAIKSIYFRYKINGWRYSGMKIVFANDETYLKSIFEDPYLIAFTKNFSLLDACHRCQYTNLQRPSDITVADYWGYISRSKQYQCDGKGISMIMINTARGENIFSQIAGQIKKVETSLADAVESNPCLSHPFIRNPKADLFWECYLKNKANFQACCDILPKPRSRSLSAKISAWMNDHQYLFPERLWRLYLVVKKKKHSMQSSS